MKALERPDGYHIPPKWSAEQGTPRPIRCVNCCHASQDDTRRLYCLALGTEHILDEVSPAHRFSSF